ncbi:MAG: YggS family pyridoxal phosphate-dependent enzyme [Xanthomonadales bacterium]|nr:YggS family pyridoxal phosphate-dependent enzyme [Xanthomonadales bacterium]
MNNLKENLNNVSARLERACASAGRHASQVRLLAVSKHQPADAVRELHIHGQRAFGENIVQQALQKQSSLADLPLEWHFIGHIQSNKTAEIAAHFDWVQSVDREKLLRRLSQQRPEGREPLNVCIQVNIDEEPQKSGCLPDEMLRLAAIGESLPGIRLRGLMAIPAVSDDGGAAIESFRRVKALFDECRSAGHVFDTLSMGMSSDMERAIEAGSTMVRVGTDLFGARTQDRT